MHFIKFSIFVRLVRIYANGTKIILVWFATLNNLYFYCAYGVFNCRIISCLLCIIYLTTSAALQCQCMAKWSVCFNTLMD